MGWKMQVLQLLIQISKFCLRSLNYFLFDSSSYLFSIYLIKCGILSFGLLSISLHKASKREIWFENISSITSSFLCKLHFFVVSWAVRVLPHGALNPHAESETCQTANDIWPLLIHSVLIASSSPLIRIATPPPVQSPEASSLSAFLLPLPFSLYQSLFVPPAAAAFGCGWRTLTCLGRRHSRADHTLCRLRCCSGQQSLNLS